MPYKSQAQRRFMHARHPKIAKRWDEEYPNQKNLPEHVKKRTKVKKKTANKKSWDKYRKKKISKRRKGNPRTDDERRERHKAMYGTTKLPPRGTGLNR